MPPRLFAQHHHPKSSALPALRPPVRFIHAARGKGNTELRKQPTARTV
jgi:hypothetical protein